MARRPNWRLAKIHRPYSVDEIARVFGVHKNTVRNWLKNGLEAIDGRRPTLVLGRTLARYLRERRARSKTPLPPSHLYCVRCRAPRRPAGNLADYRPLTTTTGNLSGLCPACEAIMNRRVSSSKLDEVGAGLEVAFQEEGERIAGASEPSAKCDSKEGESP